MIVSGGDEIRELAAEGRRIRLEGAGALLPACGQLYAASSWANMIWRLDPGTLVPTGLFAGGPGVRKMLASCDGKRLYVLCEEADSLLMLDAQDGSPLFINRAGVSPQSMALDETGSVMAVAGGASGEMILMDGETLNVTARYDTHGMVMDVLLWGKRAYALSLDETLNTLFCIFDPCGRQCMIRLPGMPGALAVLGGQVAAATHEGLFFLGCDGARVTGRAWVPGRAGRLFETADGVVMRDIWNDTLLLRENNSRWTRLAEGVADAAAVFDHA